MPADALILAPAARADVRRALERAYPSEGCGILLGKLHGDGRVVHRACPATNRWDGRRDRYRVDPELLARLLAEEDAGADRVLGFFHSHPDAAPVPSATDLDHAWPWYHYLIVPVRRGRAGRGRVWELVEGRFVERPVVRAAPTAEERRKQAASGPHEPKETTWRR